MKTRKPVMFVLIVIVMTGTLASWQTHPALAQCIDPLGNPVACPGEKEKKKRPTPTNTPVPLIAIGKFPRPSATPKPAVKDNVPLKIMPPEQTALLIFGLLIGLLIGGAAGWKRFKGGGVKFIENAGVTKGEAPAPDATFDHMDKNHDSPVDPQEYGQDEGSRPVEQLALKQKVTENPLGNLRDTPHRLHRPEGTSEDAAGDAPVRHFDIGVENPTTIGSATGGAGAGKAKFNEFQIEKPKPDTDASAGTRPSGQPKPPDNI